MKKIRNEEVKKVLPPLPHFFIAGGVRAWGSAERGYSLRKKCLLEKVNYWPLPTPTAYHLGSLGLMGLKENLVGVGSFAAVAMCV